MRRGTVIHGFFGSYSVIRQVGQGGSGRVFEVFSRDGQRLALKLFEAAGRDERKLARFKNEVRFCTEDRHPNIVRVLDLGATSEGKLLFCIMPFYEKTLRQIYSEHLSPDLRLRLFHGALDGLETAHLAGVIHRDMKPENLLFSSREGLLVATDFGASHLEEEYWQIQVVARRDERPANFRYAAPEQRAGKDADERADIFSLGLILHELFTGWLVGGLGRTTIASVFPAYGYLDAVVQKMVRQRPEDRCQTIDSVKRELAARGEEFELQPPLIEASQRATAATRVGDDLTDEELVSDQTRRLGEVLDGRAG